MTPRTESLLRFSPRMNKFRRTKDELQPLCEVPKKSPRDKHPNEGSAGTTLVEGDLLGRSGDTLLEESPVRRVRRLLDRRTPLVQPGWDDRVRVLQEADELAGEGLVGLGEERDRLAGTAGATCPSDPVDVLRGEGKKRGGGVFRERDASDSEVIWAQEAWVHAGENRRTHVFNRERESLVDDQLDLGDVETTSGDICARGASALLGPLMPRKSGREGGKTDRSPREC